jgi:hypothetical protein
MGQTIISIKNRGVPPKLFVLAVSVTDTHDNMLYSGVHYTLEEAYGFAKKDMGKYLNCDIEKKQVELLSWEIITAEELRERFEHPVSMFIPGEGLEEGEAVTPPAKVEKGLAEIARDLKVQKEVLMEKIVNDKDLGALNTYKTLFTNNEKKLLQEKILSCSKK